MKNLFLIILSFVCFNICFGQNEPHFKKNPYRSSKSLEVPKPGIPQNRLYGDLTQRVDSAWTRQFGGVGIGNITSRKSYYTYTNEHLLASESYFFYLETGEQYDGTQEEYFYNDMGQCTLHYTNEQDLNSLEWLRKNREDAVYSEEGLFKETTRSAWNKNLMQFEYIEKLTFSKTEVVWYVWDGTAWKIEVRYEYEYSSADSIQAINQYKWDEISGEWYLDFKTEYFYTNDTQLDSIINSSDSGQGLEPYSKDILFFNEQGLLESEIYSKWDGSNWETLSLIEYEYTPEGKETRWTYSEWDPNELRFVENYYEENTFTAAGDPLRYTIADYNTDTQAWEPWWNIERFYDENVDGSTIVWPNPAFYAPVSFYHKPVFNVLTIFDGNEWFFGDSTIYFYGSIISSTIPVSELNVNVYPNPASDQMTIQMEQLRPDATITFFDQQGKFAATRPLQSNVPVSISGLVPGAYVYRIRNGTEFYSGKILKK